MFTVCACKINITCIISRYQALVNICTIKWICARSKIWYACVMCGLPLIFINVTSGHTVLYFKCVPLSSFSVTKLIMLYFDKCFHSYMSMKCVMLHLFLHCTYNNNGRLFINKTLCIYIAYLLLIILVNLHNNLSQVIVFITFGQFFIKMYI